MTGKRILAVLLCACFLFSFVSCGTKNYVGRWETTVEDEALGRVELIYHFTEDGEIFLEQKDGDEIPFSIPFGTYVTDGEEMTIYSDGKESVYHFSVEKDRLVLSSEGSEDLIFDRV